MCGLPWGIIFLKLQVISIESKKSRSFASHCSHLLWLLRRFSLGTWISLIMIAASWWRDITLPSYSTVLPSAIWIHSVLLLCTTSLRTGPLWAVDSGLFEWAEANSSPSCFSRACTHLIWFGNCSMLILQPESFLSLIILGVSLSSQLLVSNTKMIVSKICKNYSFHWFGNTVTFWNDTSQWLATTILTLSVL